MAREKPRIRVDKFLNATGRIVNSGPVKAHGLILPSADRENWEVDGRLSDYITSRAS